MEASKRPIRKQKSFTIGIDLGTTNSCVALVEDGRPQVLLNAAGGRTTPSVASWYKGAEHVGEAAKRHAVLAPGAVLFSIKRIIGRRTADPKVAAFSKRTKICVVAGPDDDARVAVEFTDQGLPQRMVFSPVEVSAKILMKMKGAAERHLGKPVTDAVITVPAYFNDAQRKSTMDAGKIAGLNVKRIINEPTAAALAYGLEKNKSGTIVVYDIGGGTFDVSVLRITGGMFEVIGTDGDDYLGGDDVDDAVVAYLGESCLRQHGRDPRSNPMAHARLREAAEQAKIDLSRQKSTEITLPYLLECVNFEASLTRRDLERMAMPLIARANDICKRLMQETKLALADIDHLLLVGGTTRMPLVQETAEKLFGRKPSLDVNPDEVVALGAAVQGAVLNEDLDDILLMDVTPLTLGCGVRGDIFSRVIERNAVIPTAGKGSYTTTEDDLTTVSFRIYQGEREIASENYLLGTLVLQGIMPAPRGVPKLEVSFDLDENGVLSVLGRDQGTGNSCSIRIDNTGLLTSDEIEKMVREAKSNAFRDRQRRRTAEQRNFLDDWLKDAQQAAMALDHDRDGQVFKNIREVQEVLASNDPIEIERTWSWIYKSSRK